MPIFTCYEYNYPQIVQGHSPVDGWNGFPVLGHFYEFDVLTVVGDTLREVDFETQAIKSMTPVVDELQDEDYYDYSDNYEQRIH